MRIRNALPQTARMTASGALGVLAVGGARRLARSGATRDAAVTAATWLLRGKRQAELTAESARLTGGDIVAEARARLGEQSPVPGADVLTHQHEH